MPAPYPVIDTPADDFRGKLRETYEQYGFLLMDFEIPEDLLGQVWEATANLLGPTLNGRKQDGWSEYLCLQQLAHWPATMQCLQLLYGQSAFPFQTLNFARGTQQPVHSDSIHFNSEPPGLMCGVWTALEDVHPDSGPLVYYPCSHKLPVYTMQDFGLEPTYKSYKAYEKKVAEILKERSTFDGLQPFYAVIKKGQSVIWSANLFHGGSPIADPKRTRFSQVTHYFMEGAKYYYSPLFSAPDKIHRRPPFGIPGPRFQFSSRLLK